MRTLVLASGLGLATCSVLAACNGTVTFGPGSGGHGNTTSTSTTTTTTVTTSSTTTGSGGAGSCYETHDSFDMRLAGPDGSSWGCGVAGSTQGEFVFQAAIVESNGNDYTLDACPPNADCMPSLYKLSISAPGLYSYIPVGAYVQVSVHVYQPWGCEHALQVKNLPSWGGLPNPYYADDRVWFIGADGSATTFGDTPFTIGREGLGCYPNQPGCGQTPDDYRLVFDGGDQALVLGMGEAGTLTLPTPFWQYFEVHNLRSFETGMCDDYWNWAYFGVQNMLVD